MTDIQAAFPSPGVGARRRGPKTLPSLPLSAFTPPNTGASDRFPLPPSPSTVHPQKVIDANVVVTNNTLTQWKTEAGSTTLGEKASSVVVSLKGVRNSEEVTRLIDSLQSNADGVNVLAAVVPLSLENGVPAETPTFIASSSRIPIHLSTTYTKPSELHGQGLSWAVQQGLVVDVDAAGAAYDGEAEWEGLADLLEKALGNTEERRGQVVLSNILPPPHSLDMPIVKLLTHPSYLLYQRHMATLSLIANVHVKFLPPMWDAPTPKTPPLKSTVSAESEDKPDESVKAKNEWKRRIKMYLGPAVEAFGYQRLIFGTSPSPGSTSESNAGDWYELARESFTELGLEQEDIDAVFYTNALNVYARS